MTTKKFIEEMNKEELTQVFNANEKLQEQVREDMTESEMYWIGDRLNYVREYLSDWSVGPDQRNYIKVNPNCINEFLHGLTNMDNEVPAFSDKKAAEVIGNLQAAYDLYYYTDCNDHEHEELEEKAERAAQEAANELAKQFERDLDGVYDSENQLSYFLDFYADARMDEAETYYIIEEEGTFKLYKDVSYTQTF